MIYSFINQIKSFRKSESFNIYPNNRNRYSIIVDEKNGTQTAYCSSIPIYNLYSRKYVTRKFSKNTHGYSYIGSNANITIGINGIVMENESGSVHIGINNSNLNLKNEKIITNNYTYYPTGNGIVIESHTSDSPLALQLHLDKSFLGVHSNSKCFSIMSEKFKPHVTISVIGILDNNNNINSPAILSYHKNSKRDYTIYIDSPKDKKNHIITEINMYEQKLIQDTTVDSKYSNENNAFGSVGFIGCNSKSEEQWLYFRPDISKIPFLLGYQINSIKLHIPKLNSNKQSLHINKTAKRFCSFGTTWDKKISAAGETIEGIDSNDYLSFNLEKYMVSKINGTIMQPEGLVLSSNNLDQGFTSISTGDNFWIPQILEVNFERIVRK